jgi:zinc-ribbon domain
MARQTQRNDDWEGELGPDEDPEDVDFSEDEDDDLCVPCPYCGRQILEESERCPQCGRYISKEDAPPTKKPLWFLVGVVACLYVVYRWIVWW